VGRFFVILASVIVTGIGLGLVGGFQESDVRILGLAPVCTAPVVPCWLAFGGGTGVLVVGLGGVGVVALTIYGAGVLFATGQLAVGLLAIGQAGVGVIGWIGQVGAGATGIGQLIFGWLVRGQLPIGADGTAFHAMLFRQLKSALGPLGTRYDLSA
jgi:hypothetical protein